ncbi:MAG TPA: PIN domain-containing protein [Candidatus Thermoplasmatota archaeon]|nr:PIN domain-containing protein [Candidatus Thermoplasmatota archaeon]
MAKAARLRVVVDANKRAAALIRPTGYVSAALLRDDLEFYAPEFLLAELEDHLDVYAVKAGCPRSEMRGRVQLLASKLLFVPLDALLAKQRDARVLRASRVDPDDAPYLATVAAIEADILWTSDKALRDAFPDLATPLLPPRRG